MQVYEQYVTHIQAGDADTVIDDYSADAILTTFEGVISGREALRHYFVEYLSAHGDIEILSTDQAIEADDAFYVEATVRSGGSVLHVYNAFVVRDGKITHQFASLK